MQKIDRNLQELIQELRSLNVKLGVKEGNLHISAPKGVIKSDLRNELVQRKDELINHLLVAEKSGLETSNELSKVSREEMSALPLSYSQEGVWFLEKLNPGTASYHIPFGIEFVGDLRPEILQESIRWLVKRHESLRTYFHEHDGLPYPIIVEEVELPLEEIDLTEFSEQDREFVWGQRLRDFLHGSFNLAQAPLFRTILIKLEPNRSHLIFNFHHIIADGWSLGIMMRELGDAYTAFLSGFMPTADPLPIQFVDYAVWQRNSFKKPSTYSQQLDYWEKHLAGAPPLINLPTDRPRHSDMSGEGGIINFRVNREISAGIRQLAKRENTTLFMVLLAAFYVLLHRYSRQEDIVVGTPVSNRPLEEFESIVGFFANTLAFRSTVDPNKSFVDFLRDVRTLTLEGFDNQEIPFEMIVDHLQPKRSSAYNPFYQVMFVLQNNQVEWPDIKGLETRLLNHFAMENSRLDLFFEMWEEGDYLIGQVEYDSHLYDIMSVRRMVSHFVTLLNGITRMSTGRIAELPLMLPNERNQIIHEWNRTEFPYPNEALLHELFELQVRRTATKVALKDPTRGVEYTWHELNQKSNQLACFLKENGIPERSLIGVSMERSAEMIISLLAISKLSSAWLPLDPDYPQPRLQAIVDDADPVAVLTKGGGLDWLQQSPTVHYDLDEIFEKLDSYSDKNLPPKIDSNAPLYVLYTSGSTGKPKGVVAPHKSAINRFSWMWNKFPFSSDEVCVQKTSLGFVDSVWEIFGPLLKGVPLVIAPNSIAHNPSEFITFLQEYRITRIVLVPSMLKAILQQDPELGNKLQRLRICTSSGEPLSIDLYRRFSDALPFAKLLNIYGSSEVGADVTCIDTNQYPTPNQMFVGKPIDNMKIYILDEFLEPVPIGVPGEICVSGPGVADGYYNNLPLTAEKFVDNPFELGSMMFRTGDLARFNSDGQIEYLGRSDFQIKVRGVRIEPSEIEQVLLDHPDINQAIVGSWEIDGNNELVSWFHLADQVETSPDISSLRSLLLSRLPNYMVPTRFVNLPEIPRLPNGKIDRKNLPTPTLEVYRQSLPYTPPTDDVEHKLAEIWRKVLNQELVGLYDDFFELGGQSIRAVQMFGLIRDEFDTYLELSHLFESPTIAKLASLIREAQSRKYSGIIETKAGSIPKIRADQTDRYHYLITINQGGSSQTPYFCVHGAGGNVLFFQQWKKHLGNTPFYAFQARGVDGISMPHESIREMASDYLDEMLDAYPEGPWILGGYSGGGVVALEMAIQLKERGHELPPIIMLDTFHPSIQPKNYTMRDRVHLLTTNPVDYVKSVAQKKVVDNFKREYSREELDEMMASGTPLPIELRNDYMTDQFAKLLEQYPSPQPYDGVVLLLCAEEIWHMFAHAGHKRGWENVLTNLIVHEVPGDHFAIIEEPAVVELIAQLKKWTKSFSQ